MTMSSSHKTLLLLYFIFIFFRFSPLTVAQTFYLDHDCSTNKTFTANSSYQSKLTTIFSTLASRNVEFYNTTVSGSGNTVYGLFMCRGDVSLQVCSQCVTDATQRLPSLCPISKEAVIWYNECMLRYSNHSFFSGVALRPIMGLYNEANVTDQASFMKLLYNVLNETADVAAKHALGKKKYATKEVNISESQTLYCLTQCTPDLSPGDCRMCLDRVIGKLGWCCTGSVGGRVLNPSCNFRYELYPFYGPGAINPLVAPAPAPVTAISPPASSSDPQVKEKGRSSATSTIVIVVVSITGSGILFGFAYYLFRKQMKKKRRDVLRQKYFGSEGTTLEPLQFNLATIETATNQFSHENSLGKGGFGQVYKGILSNGQEIAVKRLSKVSVQGAEEFKNEVLLIAKLQHRNLVALLGFCIDDQEKILIYEYVPNRSLDFFLFDSQNGKVLTWLERCKIIGGVARGILYLHDYSRLKIIHRDLKPSNILLDDELNPKISDFGLAKMVAINENEGNTNRIVGTYGYMSPEYAMFGQYSEKSDVFSFGVIILEVISGRKNRSRHNQSQYADSLLTYAWKKWNEEKFLEILDSNLTEFESSNEMIKCIHIGLLCVQENPDARPSMATIIPYLSDDSIQLPFPQEPAFFLHDPMEPNIESLSGESCSTNEVSKSEFFPR